MRCATTLKWSMRSLNTLKNRAVVADFFVSLHPFKGTFLMNQYETVFILNPVLSDDQIRETVDKYTSSIKAAGGSIINVERWGLRKLAYPIDKKKSGFYNLVEFTAPSPVIASLELDMKRDERVLRFLTVVLDQHGVAYAAKRRDKVKNA